MLCVSKKLTVLAMSSVSPSFVLVFILQSPGSQKSCGCIVLFRHCLSLVNFSSDDAGRFVLCEFRFHGKLFRVASLHAPNCNPARDQFLELVPSWVDPLEFYLKFWEVLGEDLVEVFNYCFNSGFLTKSQRQGVISLSFKKGESLDPKNWRPITLLNVD